MSDKGRQNTVFDDLVMVAEVTACAGMDTEMSLKDFMARCIG
jgi:hypothetical protein